MNYIYSPTPIHDTAQYTSNQIADALTSGKSVLWLLSGGSGIEAAIQAAKHLQGVPLNNLYVSLTDERFGPVGHGDENWQQLLDAGLSLPDAQLYRPLIGEDRATTTIAFATWIETVLATVDYSIAIFGIGTDGHTAGIKPHTLQSDNTDIAYHFTGEDHERISMTYRAIRQIDEIVLQVSGSSKQPALRQLFSETIPSIDNFPAAILHEVPNCTVYSDTKKEDIS